MHMSRDMAQKKSKQRNYYLNQYFPSLFDNRMLLLRDAYYRPSDMIF